MPHCARLAVHCRLMDRLVLLLLCWLQPVYMLGAWADLHVCSGVALCMQQGSACAREYVGFVLGGCPALCHKLPMANVEAAQSQRQRGRAIKLRDTEWHCHGGPIAGAVAVLENY